MTSSRMMTLLHFLAHLQRIIDTKILKIAFETIAMTHISNYSQNQGKYCAFLSCLTQTWTHPCSLIYTVAPRLLYFALICNT